MWEWDVIVLVFQLSMEDNLATLICQLKNDVIQVLPLVCCDITCRKVLVLPRYFQGRECSKILGNQFVGSHRNCISTMMG